MRFARSAIRDAMIVEGNGTIASGAKDIIGARHTCPSDGWPRRSIIEVCDLFGSELQ